MKSNTSDEWEENEKKRKNIENSARKAINSGGNVR